MELTNVEFMFLQIICNRNGVSGYEINHLMKEQDYKAWAGIGNVSLGVALKKLSKKQLIKSYINTTRQGKDFLSRNFEITNAGEKLLQQEILSALSSSRERDYRFDLGLAAITLVATEDVVAALKHRKVFLVKVAEAINTIFQSQNRKELPLNLRALFRHPLIVIKQEIEFMNILLREI